jgi:acetyltransferase-like isoleucine patch superfamily enzyme
MDPAAGLIMAQPLTGIRPVEIGAGTFLGYRAMVLPGVTLGEHCVVGAGAVVTKSFPAGTRLVGVPARPIGAGDE